MIKFLPVLWALLFSVAAQLEFHDVPVGGIFDQDDMASYNHWMDAINAHNKQGDVIFTIKPMVEFINLNSINTQNDVIQKFCNLTTRGVVAMFGVNHPFIEEAIWSYTSRLHMPYITHSHAYDGSHKYTYVLNIRPQYAGALVKVMEDLKWTRIHYFYEDFAGMKRAQEVISKLHEEDINIEVLLRKIHNITHAKDEIQKIVENNEGSRNDILIDLNLTDMKIVVTELMHATKKTIHKFHFLSGGLNFNELGFQNYTRVNVNISGVSMDDEGPVHRPFRKNALKKHDPARTHVSEIADESVRVFVIAMYGIIMSHTYAMDSTLLKNPTRFMNGYQEGIPCDIVPEPWRYGPIIMSALKDVRYAGLTGHVSFTDAGYRKDCTLTISQISTSGHLVRRGTWNPVRGMILNKGVVIQLDIHDEDRTQVVTVKESLPYVFWKKHSENGEPLIGRARWQGYCVDIFNAVARMWGISYIIKPVADNNYGTRIKNGSWNGMIKEILHGEADIAMGDFTVTQERGEVVFFSEPILSSGLTIMMTKPDDEKFNPFGFLDPLAYELWLCIVCAYIAVSVLLFVVGRFSRDEWVAVKQEDGSSRWENELTFGNTLWFSIGAFMQQGCEINPKATAPRIVTSAWWLFTLILIASYTANLAAFLTMQRMVTSIETVEDLASQTEVKYGCITSGATRDFFKKSQISTFERMWTFIKSNPSLQVNSGKEGIDRVRKSDGNYAFIASESTITYNNHRKPCNTMRVGSLLNEESLAIAMSYDSKLKEKVSIAVLELHENGFLPKVYAHWWKNSTECKDEGEAKVMVAHSLTLEKIHGVFIILLFGIITSIITLVAEMYYKRITSKKKTAGQDGEKKEKKIAVKQEVAPTQISSVTVAPGVLLSLDDQTKVTSPTDSETKAPLAPFDSYEED